MLADLMPIEEATEIRTWEHRLKEAKAYGSFSREDVQLADSLNTCAVAEHCNFHADLEGWSMRDKFMAENGETLLYLGDKFTLAVRANDVEEAINIFNQIKEL